MEWQPIETAPKDGSEVLLFVPSASFGRNVMSAVWDNDNGGCDASWVVLEGYIGEYNPTHWMPLPPPPST